MSTTPDRHPVARDLARRLQESQIFRDYEEAFTGLTGLPLALRAVDSLEQALRHKRNEAPFCALMAQTNKSCSACLELQRRVEVESQLAPKTLKCFAGLCESTVPIRVGEDVVAFLQTGQVLLHQPNKREFKKTTRLLLKFGAEVDVKRLEEAYYQTRVLGRKQYESLLRLLAVFAQHLAALSNQLMMAREAPDEPMIAKAKLYIAENQGSLLQMKQVAQSTNTSAFHFCKKFKRATGLTFTEYLARVRVERVKNMLQNPHRRISEAAYEAGFQSLSQFGRVFRRIVGESPSSWREKILRHSAA